MYSKIEEMVKAPTALASSVDSVERWPLVAFVVSALICLGLSTAYHLVGLSNDRW